MKLPSKTLLALGLMLYTSHTAIAEGVLVLGATGQLGARITKSLLDRGEQVTAFVRHSSDRSRLEGLNIEYVVGDILDEESVAVAFSGRSYRVIINAVRGPTEIVNFYKDSSLIISKHAQQASVKQIIHHGAVGAGSNMKLHPNVPWENPPRQGIPSLVERMLDHGVAEEVFFSSGIPTTIIRNSRVWPDETPASGQATLTEDRSVLTPITRIDLARFTMDCLDNKACFGKVYHNKDESLAWPPPSFVFDEN